MVNVGAIALFVSNNQGGGFGGGSFNNSGDYDKDGKIINNRYAELDEEVKGKRVDGTSALTAYLDGRCTLDSWGTTDRSNFIGEHAKAEMNRIEEYREFAEQKLSMITPPSFMEKLMTLRLKMKTDKTMRTINKSTLGIAGMAAGMISVTARSYGKAKHYVMTKFGNEKKDPQKQTFKERLGDIQERVKYKRDIKKLDTLKEARDATQERGALARKTSFAEGMTRHHSPASYSSLLGRYLHGAALIDESGKGTLNLEKYDRYSYQNKEISKMPATSVDEVNEVMAKAQQQIDMVPPSTKVEAYLMEQMKKLPSLEKESVESRKFRQMNKMINKAAKKYIAAKEKEDPNFKGKESMFQRLSDLRMRGEYEQDVVKLGALKQKMSGGRS